MLTFPNLLKAHRELWLDYEYIVVPPNRYSFPTMPYYTKRARKLKRSRKGRKTYRKRRTKPGKLKRLKTIQNATYVPKKKLVNFSIYYNFTNNSDATGASAELNYIYFYANSPYVPLAHSSNHWTLNEGSYVKNALGLCQWVTDKDPGLTDLGMYRQATVIGSKIQVQAVPQHQQVSTADSYEDVPNLLVHKTTDAPWANRTTINSLGPSYANACNLSALSKLPMTMTGQMHTNPNGAPKGKYISMKYNYKSMNGIKGRDQAMFSCDSHPNEKDWFGVAIMQSKPGSTNPELNVKIKITYTCLLGEPNHTRPYVGDIITHAT